MKRRQFLKTSAVAAASALPLWGSACSLSKQKPNILFIAVDDLNEYPNVLSGYPGLKTPALDKFAQTAVNFKRGYCAAPACNPSRSAILTGLAPNVTGLYANMDYQPNSKPAMAATHLPEHFKNNGYTTLWSGKIYHSRPGAKRMQAMWDDDRGHDGGYGPQPEVDNIPRTFRKPGWFNYQPWDGPDTDFPDVVNTDLTIERLQQTYDQPFFMALGLYRPHNPWTAPRRFFDQYPLDSITMPEVPENDLEDIPAIGRQWADHPVDFEALKRVEQWKPVVRSYLASISFTDYNIGRVLNALENSPHRDNTIVVIWADHGFHWGEKEHFAKFALWELTTRTLFMWRVPGLSKPGTECQAPVQLVDIFPTLVDCCDLPQPRQSLSGHSLKPLLKNTEHPWKHPALTFYKGENVAVRNKRFRYIRYEDNTEELYDHENDPNEWSNVADVSEFQNDKEQLAARIPNSFVKRSGPKDLDYSKENKRGYW